MTVKIIIFALVLILVSANVAFACCGTEGYPKKVKALGENQSLSAEQKLNLMKDLMAGLAMHDDGHKTNNLSEMGRSLQTLRFLQSKIRRLDDD